MSNTNNHDIQTFTPQYESRVILNEFLDVLDAQGKSETTIDAYLLTVDRYLKMGSPYPVFSKQRVNQYLAEGRRQGNSGNTLRVKFYILKTFFRAFGEEYPFDKHDLPPPSPKHKPKISHDQMKKLESIAKSDATTNKPVLRIRNWALIRMANALGLRRIEFQRMNIEDCSRARD
jgi:site-specific recombinase XerD